MVNYSNAIEACVFFYRLATLLVSWQGFLFREDNLPESHRQFYEILPPLLRPDSGFAKAVENQQNSFLNFRVNFILSQLENQAVQPNIFIFLRNLLAVLLQTASLRVPTLSIKIVLILHWI